MADDNVSYEKKVILKISNNRKMKMISMKDHDVRVSSWVEKYLATLIWNDRDG